MKSANDSDVFERVLRPHLDRLYRLAWRLAGSRHDAEDLFQEVLVRAYAKLDELVRIEEPGAWLGRVMYNLFVDEHRRFRRRRLRIVDESDLPGDGIAAFAGNGDPHSDSERDEALKHVAAALERLPEEQRLILLLHDAEGYKLADIGALTGAPLGTVKSRLHRARARLRQILEDDGTFSAHRTCYEVDRA